MTINKIKISIIIPTYNRKNVLIKCVKAMFNQNYPKDKYEIIIVDDGSTDATEDLVKELIKEAPCQLQYFKQGNKGPAAARNIGIKNTKGELILFTGDDCIADKNLIKEHVYWHEIYNNENVAILGYTTWHPELKITPFMYWLEHVGPQFAYYRFKHGERVDSLWTCNISLKRNFMVFFDEDFPYAAHEDTEIGYRLQKRGLQIIFNKNAITYHYHPTDIEKYCYRQRIVGISAVILHKKHPSSFALPLQNKSWRGISWSICEFIIPYLKRFVLWIDQRNIKLPYLVYRVIMSYYFQLGVNEMINKPVS